MFPTVVAFSKFHFWLPFHKEHYLASKDLTEPLKTLIEVASFFIKQGRQPPSQQVPM
jgi:hypothetical protein